MIFIAVANSNDELNYLKIGQEEWAVIGNPPQDVLVRIIRIEGKEITFETIEAGRA